jgi:hypothetical protein
MTFSLACDRYGPCNHCRSMRVRPKGVIFVTRKRDTSLRSAAEAGVAEGRTKTDVGGFLTPCGDFVAEPIDRRIWPTEADLTRCVTAEALCDISPNSAR